MRKKFYKSGNKYDDDNEYSNGDSCDKPGLVAAVPPIPLGTPGRVARADAVVAAAAAVAVARARVLAVRDAGLESETEVACRVEPNVVRCVWGEQGVVQPHLKVVVGALALATFVEWGDTELNLLRTFGELCVTHEADDQGFEGRGVCCRGCLEVEVHGVVWV